MLEICYSSKGAEGKGVFFGLVVTEFPGNVLVSLRDKSTEAIFCVVTLRQKLHGILTDIQRCLVKLTSVPLQARACLIPDWLSVVLWCDDLKPERPGLVSSWAFMVL